MAVNDLIYTYPKGFVINNKSAQTRAKDGAEALRRMGYIVRTTQNKNEYRVIATPPKRR